MRYQSSGVRAENLALTGKTFQEDNVLQDEVIEDQLTLDEIKDQFKVFRDPTF